MLIAHLPKEKIAVQGDLFWPPAPGEIDTPANQSFYGIFYDNVKRLKLDIAQIVGIHGEVVPMTDFLKLAGEIQ